MENAGAGPMLIVATSPTKGSAMKATRFAVFGLVAGLLGGGAAGIALGVPGLASAQSEEAPTDEAPATPEEKPERGQWMTDALAPLVSNGTITQAQADAVIDALQNARPAKGPGHHRGRHLRHHGLDAAATALGMTEADLLAALRDGQTVAQVAESKGVAVDTVVDAIVNEIETKLDAQVASGRLTQAQADEMLTRATERTKAFVNGERSEVSGDEAKPFGRPHRGPRPGLAPSGSGSGSSATPSEGTTTA
jgi:hypothetical protein